MNLPTNAYQIIYALQENMSAQIKWLKSCQVLEPSSKGDGAIKRYPDQGGVSAYFANFAAMAILEDRSSYPLVERYLDWYLRNLESNGTIMDYQYDGGTAVKTSRPDSEDAYAGTFLSLVSIYHEKTGHTGWVRKNLPNLKKVASVIVNLMDRDGLTFALASYRVKYLMDNCEAYRGLYDFSELLDYLGDGDSSFFRKKAAQIAYGTERELWNKRALYYHPSKTGCRKEAVKLQKFYPDAACQLFPAIYGLIKPESDRASRLYRLFNENQQDWVNIKPPDYPWVILGYCAGLHGDYLRAYEKIRFVREAYLNNDSGNWYCAEAAFFVLTCSLLIKYQNLWL